MDPNGNGGSGVQHVNTAEELHAALSEMPAPGEPARVLLSTLQKFPSLRRRQVRGAPASPLGAARLTRRIGAVGVSVLGLITKFTPDA